MEIGNSYNDILDCVIFLIYSYERKNKELNFNTLISVFKENVYNLNVNEAFFEEIIEKLKTDKKIYENQNGEYKLFNTYKNVKGYNFESLTIKNYDLKKNRLDKLFKIIPLILTFVFGLSTLYLSKLNYDINLENLKLKIKADSLDQVVKEREKKIPKLDPFCPK